MFQYFIYYNNNYYIKILEYFCTYVKISTYYNYITHVYKISLFKFFQSIQFHSLLHFHYYCFYFHLNYIYLNYKFYYHFHHFFHFFSI